jgi:hypothetical protein
VQGKSLKNGKETDFYHSKAAPLAAVFVDPFNIVFLPVKKIGS